MRSGWTDSDFKINSWCECKDTNLLKCVSFLFFKHNGSYFVNISFRIFTENILECFERQPTFSQHTQWFFPNMLGCDIAQNWVFKQIFIGAVLAVFFWLGVFIFFLLLEPHSWKKLQYLALYIGISSYFQTGGCCLVQTSVNCLFLHHWPIGIKKGINFHQGRRPVQ